MLSCCELIFRGLRFVISGDHSWCLDLLINIQYSTVPGFELKQGEQHMRVYVAGGVDDESLSDIEVESRDSWYLVGYDCAVLQNCVRFVV